MSSESAATTWQELHGHKDLPKFLDQLADTDMAQLKLQLVALETMLSSHFKEEDGPGGWFDQLRDEKPHYASRIVEMREEHARILTQLDGLLGNVNTFLESLGKIQRGTEELRSLIEDHCAAEHKLALDAYFTDDGCAAD